MKIALTGGSGFIGSKVASKLLTEGHELAVLDVIAPTNSKIQFRKVDIMNRQALVRSLRGFDTVYHLAGCVVDVMRKQPYTNALLNINGTLNVLEACRLNNIRRILYASSFYVYDGINPKDVVNEETPLDVRRMELFGSTKLMGEALILEYSKKYGIDYVILRFGPAYGWGNCTSAPKTFIETGLKKEPLEIWGEGKRKNQYTYVEDIADGCVLAINEHNQTFNLISPEYVSVGELAQLMNRKYGFEVVYNTIHKEGPSMPYITSLRAQETFGWKAIPLEVGIETTLSEARKASSSR